VDLGLDGEARAGDALPGQGMVCEAMSEMKLVGIRPISRPERPSFAARPGASGRPGGGLRHPFRLGAHHLLRANELG